MEALLEGDIVEFGGMVDVLETIAGMKRVQKRLLWLKCANTNLIGWIAFIGQCQLIGAQVVEGDDPSLGTVAATKLLSIAEGTFSVMDISAESSSEVDQGLLVQVAGIIENIGNLTSYMATLPAEELSQTGASGAPAQAAVAEPSAPVTAAGPTPAPAPAPAAEPTPAPSPVPAAEPTPTPAVPVPSELSVSATPMPSSLPASPAASTAPLTPAAATPMPSNPSPMPTSVPAVEAASTAAPAEPAATAAPAEPAATSAATAAETSDDEPEPVKVQTKEEFLSGWGAAVKGEPEPPPLNPEQTVDDFAQGWGAVADEEPQLVATTAENFSDGWGAPDLSEPPKTSAIQTFSEPGLNSIVAAVTEDMRATALKPQPKPAEPIPVSVPAPEPVLAHAPHAVAALDSSVPVVEPTADAITGNGPVDSSAVSVQDLMAPFAAASQPAAAPSMPSSRGGPGALLKKSFGFDEDDDDNFSQSPEAAAQPATAQPAAESATMPPVESTGNGADNATFTPASPGDWASATNWPAMPHLSLPNPAPEPEIPTPAELPAIEAATENPVPSSETSRSVTFESQFQLPPGFGSKMPGDSKFAAPTPSAPEQPEIASEEPAPITTLEPAPAIDSASAPAIDSAPAPANDPAPAAASTPTMDWSQGAFSGTFTMQPPDSASVETDSETGGEESGESDKPMGIKLPQFFIDNPPEGAPAAQDSASAPLQFAIPSPTPELVAKDDGGGWSSALSLSSQQNTALNEAMGVKDPGTDTGSHPKKAVITSPQHKIDAQWLSGLDSDAPHDDAQSIESASKEYLKSHTDKTAEPTTTHTRIKKMRQAVTLEPQPEPSKGKPWLIPVIILVVVILLAGGGAAYYFLVMQQPH